MYDEGYQHPLPRYYRKKIWQDFPESLTQVNYDNYKVCQDKEMARLDRQISKYGVELSVNIEQARRDSYKQQVAKSLKKNRNI